MNGMSMRMEKAKSSMDSAVRNDKQSAGIENRTGIPAQLKERLEQSTGISLDDVRVHYNSALPARLDAWAYTKGNEVEIGPGQERHLPHELGHVVQQKLGAVRANAKHSSGVALNTDPVLEHQADEIGAGKRVTIVQRMVHNVVQRLSFSRAAQTHMGDPQRQVPEELIQYAIDHGTARPDPRGSRATMYYTTVTIRGSLFNFEVLYYPVTDMVYHFLYTRRARGPLPRITSRGRGR